MDDHVGSSRVSVGVHTGVRKGTNFSARFAVLICILIVKYVLYDKHCDTIFNYEHYESVWAKHGKADYVVK